MLLLCMQDDLPLKTPEDAKRYFQEMGCSHFHMCREWPARYDEYRRLGISKETELEWTVEECRAVIARLKSGELKPEELWTQHFHLATLVEGHKLWNLLEEVFEATLAIEVRLPSKGRVLVLETITGRSDIQFRDGLIFRSHDSGRAAQAAGFAEVAHRLAAGSFDCEEDQKRAQVALARVMQMERICGLSQG